jgi:hypothetical protein
MAIYMIGYDLHPSKGETYEELIAAIKKLGDWWHCLDSTWLLRCELTAVQIRDYLWKHMKADDQLLVVQYARPGSAWVGFSGDCAAWLKNNM